MQSYLKRNASVFEADNNSEFPEHKILQRVPMPYVPSIDNYDSDNDADENYDAKKGVKYKGKAKKNREYRGYEELNKEKREIVDKELESIQNNLRRRAIKPTDETEYKRLKEMEQSKAGENGPAAMTLFHKTKKVDGTFEMNEFADLVSSVHKGVQQNTETSASFHAHEDRETKLYQMKHAADNAKKFAEDPMFACALFENHNAPKCTLMQMNQYHSCESEFDECRARYLRKEVIMHKFGEFVNHFFETCGFRLFCAYVAYTAPRNLFAAFEMDGVRRYFVTIVFSMENNEDIMSKAVEWCDESLQSYKELMKDWQKGINTFKPCTDIKENSNFWALYDITMSKKLQNEAFKFEYAYYTACQCVDLKSK